jgi:predicted MFS family arabinose efflux permease
MPNQKNDLTFRFINFFGLGLELITLMFGVRLIVDSGTRIFMPFVPQLASGLGLSITAFSWILALRVFMGLASPVVGVLADRYGRRLVMIVMLLLRGVSFFGLAVSHSWWSAIPMLLISLTNSCILPAQKAYLSDQVSYERRGRALATVDASFATAGMVGLPLVGWLLEVWGWQLPLYIFAALHLLAAGLIGFRLPKTFTRTASSTAELNRWKLFLRPQIFASVVVSILLITVFVLFMMFWALWLVEDFGLGPLEIGMTATYIGIAEFIGLLLAGLFIDRIGKRRGTLISLFASFVFFGLIPLFQGSLLGIRFSLVLTAIAIEFAVTAAIPLFAEQAPAARATVFSLVAFGNTVGAGIGPPLTTTLWASGGLIPIIIAGASASLLAFFIVGKFLYDSPDVAPVQAI